MAKATTQDLFNRRKDLFKRLKSRHKPQGPEQAKTAPEPKAELFTATRLNLL